MFNIGPLEMLAPFVIAAAAYGVITLRRRSARASVGEPDARRDSGR